MRSDEELAREVVEKLNEKYMEAGGDDHTPLAIHSHYIIWAVMYDGYCVFNSEEDLDGVGVTEAERMQAIEKSILATIREHANKMLCIFR